MNENGNELFFNESDEIVPKTKRKIKMPSKEKMEKIAKIAGGTGTVLFHGSKIALKVARIGANLASKGINAISKSDILKKTVPSLLTLGANVAILPLALTEGLGNMIIFRKNPDFLNNVLRWNYGIKRLTTPVINNIIAPVLEATSGILDKATEKSMVERISEATGGQYTPDQVRQKIREGMSFVGGQVAGIGGKIAEGLFGPKNNSNAIQPDQFVVE